MWHAGGATDVGGVAEITGDTGCVVPLFTPERKTGAFEDTLHLRAITVHLARLHEDARGRIAKHFSTNNMVKG